MPSKDVLRYGFYYALVYVGVLALLSVGAMIVAAFYEFRPSNLSIGALIGAALATYLRFIKDKVRLPTTREYWSLVAIGTIIVLVVDFTLSALIILYLQGKRLDGTSVLIMIAIPLFTGVFGNMVFYRRGGFGEKTLHEIEAKRAQPDPPAATPKTPMTFADIGPVLACYFAVYIPLYMITRYAAIAIDFPGEVWLPPAITFVAAVCALASVVRRWGRRPALTEYGLLILASVAARAAFEFAGETAIYHYRFAELPRARPVLTYMAGSAVTSAVVFAVAYSRPVAWLVRPRARTA